MQGHRVVPGNSSREPFQKNINFLIGFWIASVMDFGWFWRSFRWHFWTYSYQKAYIYKKCFKTFSQARTPDKTHVFWEQSHQFFMKKSVQESYWFRSRDFIDFIWILVPKITSFWWPWGGSGFTRVTLGLVLVTHWVQILKNWPNMLQNVSKVIKITSQSHQNDLPKSPKREP